MVSIAKDLISPEGLRTIANYLRSQHGVKVKSGIQHEKRVDYFKGKRLVESLLNAKKWPKSLPLITEKEVALEVALLLLKNQFYHKSERIDGKKGYLKAIITREPVFEESGYYTWIFAGNTTWANIGTGAIIACVIGFTLLPIWPDIAKIVLWYISVTFILVTLSFCLVRFLIFVVSWLFGYEFWIFPRLFDESLSFQDSFKPVYSIEKSAAGQGYYRIGLVVAIIGFVYWAATQPTEFDGFIQAQKDFLDDLYSGNLIADVSQDHKDNIDKIKSRIPKLDELMQEMEYEGEEFVKAENGENGMPTVSEVKTHIDQEAAVEEEAFDDAMFDELINSLEEE